MTLYNIDDILATELSKSPGAWAVVGVTGTYYCIRHEMTEQVIYVRKVGERGAFIIKTDDGNLHWTGHKLEVGLREATDHLIQHNRKR